MKEIEAPTVTVAYNQPREWMLWTIAMIGGWLLGLVINILAAVLINVTGLGVVLQGDPETVPQEAVLLLMGVWLVASLIMGLCIGAPQEVLLRRLVPGLQRWTLLTGVGFAAGAFMAQWGLPFFLGVGVGLMQWLLLRRDLNKAGWWPVMNVLAWPLGSMFGGGLGQTIGQALGNSDVGYVLSFALTGAIIGAITGAVLLWMLRENAALLEGLRLEREAEQAKQ
jgi:hypothetical protein